MQLNEIAFPVFKLGNAKPILQDGVLFYLQEGTKQTEEGLEQDFRIKVVDDTNLPGDSLAKRRLVIRANGDIPYKLNRAIFFLGDFIKISLPSMWFIDSVGKVFQYTKSTRAKLTYRRVTKVIHINTGGAIIEVEGMHTRMKSLFMPTLNRETLHAGILLLGMSPILYGYYDQKYPDSWRLV